jgi:hypothetical protein
MEEEPQQTSPTPSKHAPAIRVSAETQTLATKLADHYGTSQGAVTLAALRLLQDRVDSIDVIQVPELMCSLVDLQDSVGRLVFMAEHLERLAWEVAAYETSRPR